MKIYTEQSLTNFEFWSDAKDNANELSHSHLEALETILKDMFLEGCTDTTIKEWLGIEEEEETEEESEEEEEN